MSQVVLSATNVEPIIEQSIFTPGRVWSDNTGKIYDVEESDA